MSLKSKEYAWEQKYRPFDNINDIILNPEHQLFFNGIIKENRIPNMILYGPPGLGKTTTVLTLVNQLKKDYMFLNGRTDGRIDVLETKVEPFVSTKSFNGEEKIVIYDEGDASSHAVLDALKVMIEKYSKNATFIITSNHVNKFKDAIRSRMNMINFALTEKNKTVMQKNTLKRIIRILKNEKVEIEDINQLALFVKKTFPDIRNMIKTLQMFSISYNKKIPASICEESEIFNVSSFVKMLDEFKYEDIVKFVENNNSEMIYVFVQENLKELVKPNNYYEVLRTINSYSYQEAFTMTKNANTICCLKDLSEYVKGV